MKRKRIVIKTLLIIVYFIVNAIYFVDSWEMSRTQNRFNDIEHRISLESSLDKPELILNYCDTVSRFVIDNPIVVKVDFNCNDYDLNDSTRIESFWSDFIARTNEIDDDYRKQSRTANRKMFIVLIISLIILSVGLKLIDKKLRVE